MFEVITLVVEVATPFTAVESVLPETTAEFAPTTCAVEATPLTVVVKVLPVSVVAMELTRLANDELMPFTMTLKRLADEEATLVLITVVDAVTPLIVLVSTFEEEMSTLVVLDATMFAREVVATTPFTVLVRVVPEVLIV